MTELEVNMAGLSEKTCVPCRGGVPPLTAEEIKPLESQVKDWAVVNNHHVEKEFRFPDFKTALHFVNKVGQIHCIGPHFLIHCVYNTPHKIYKHDAGAVGHC